MLLIKAGVHKMLVQIANREDPDRLLLQKQSDLGLRCLSSPLWQATSVRNFRTFTNVFYIFQPVSSMVLSAVYLV